MRFSVLASMCLLGGCATTSNAAHDEGEPIAPSKVKTVQAPLAATVELIAGRAQAHQMKVLVRSETPGNVLLVLEGPLEKRAQVSSGVRGFTTDSFRFNRRYTLRFVSVDEGHTRIEVSTTAVFQDPETCNPTFALRDDWRVTPLFGTVCSLPTPTGRPNVDVVDSTERRWVAGVQDPDGEPLDELIAD